VIYHVEASVDGRTDHLAPDCARFRSLAASIGGDALLTGADTLLASLESGQEGAMVADEEDGQQRRLLAVTDSRGRLGPHWEAIRSRARWREVVALICFVTPNPVRERLAEAGVDAIEAGQERVDLPLALAGLEERYGVRTVRLHSGGRLGGAALRAGVVDELSLLLEPRLVGGASPATFFRARDPESPDQALPLELAACDPQADGALHLRYRILPGASA
jgi:2,5-diamino-6-(ribosylamino)-4(3H)-pyrimidinone 5'-phosphate reductase